MFAHTGPCDLLPTARQTMHGMSGEPVRESADGGGAFKTGRRASRTIVRRGAPHDSRDCRSSRSSGGMPFVTLSVTGLSATHLDCAQPIALTTHLDLHRDPLMHFLYV
ncbi:hypothetical protein ALO80_100923 [Pseudomonas caricapapayae]|uniref:Uncharacterized protein n=2 Tax=Pseudomonas syringae group TaxID=136849 RepID=A0A0P9KA68_9PSED|nr:hypothetical protein ALO80_100923 [Pseudomonas caricapapayae]KPY86721.1 hypothetical protein ALO44_100887 [Pseudomonas syringae pv. tagetis]RMM09565.1 hypothetical protein ALQ84_100854 [Pseudomonas caricapapayae]RMV93180.1 hypothetical protein ALP01_100621 [Pseudomonas caricapapayae]RMW16104.1 hypothetical protein ALO97_100816 [Pseudomonas syringae pv. tagetis]